MQPTEQSQSQTPRMSQEQLPKQMQMQPAMEMNVVGTAPTSTQPGQQDPMRVRGGGAGKVRYLLVYLQPQLLATAQTSLRSCQAVAASRSLWPSAFASASRTSSAARARCSAKQWKVLRAWWLRPTLETASVQRSGRPRTPLNQPESIVQQHFIRSDISISATLQYLYQ
ncbi:hypothetical protein K525DRAFT_185247 [Schizophyllum commune Loenen D]|nr:hypothetical protein K525DRAFT_185247 [Schizophyllum commune Loenen D]